MTKFIFKNIIKFFKERSTTYDGVTGLNKRQSLSAIDTHASDLQLTPNQLIAFKRDIRLYMDLIDTCGGQDCQLFQENLKVLIDAHFQENAQYVTAILYAYRISINMSSNSLISGSYYDGNIKRELLESKETNLTIDKLSKYHEAMFDQLEKNCSTENELNIIKKYKLELLGGLNHIGERITLDNGIEVLGIHTHGDAYPQKRLELNSVDCSGIPRREAVICHIVPDEVKHEVAKEMVALQKTTLGSQINGLNIHNEVRTKNFNNQVSFGGNVHSNDINTSVLKQPKDNMELEKQFTDLLNSLSKKIE